jgi:threonine dehydrogenase-like Zn-dependent dehydrogenase
VQRIVFEQPRHVSVHSCNPRSLAAGEVRVVTECSLISNGTERLALSGDFELNSHWARWVRYPFYPGYATIGRVIEIQGAVIGASLGDLVALRVPHASEHIVRASECIPVPKSIEVETAAWFAVARIAFLGVWAAQASLHSDVLVIGGGIVAQWVVRWLKYKTTGMVSILAKEPNHINAAVAGGASRTILGSTQDHNIDTINQCLGWVPDIIIDCTADPEVLAWSLAIVRDYGRIVLLGDPGFPSKRCITPNALRRAITVVGTHDRCTYARWTNHEVAKHFFANAAAPGFSTETLRSAVYSGLDAKHAYEHLEGSHRELGMFFHWNR